MRSRAYGWVIGGAGLCSLAPAGCFSGGDVCRDAARPDAAAVLADAPALLPRVPVASTSATRGQKADPPPPVAVQVPQQPVQPVAGTTAVNTGQVAVRMRALVNQIPILDEEVREAMAQNLGELYQVPEAQRAQKQQEIYERELNRLIDRELVLEDAERRVTEMKKQDIMVKLRKAAEKETDKQIDDIKKRVNAKSPEQFKQMLQAQGLSESGMRRQFERNFMMVDYVRGLYYDKAERVSLQQIRDYYDQHADEFKTEDAVVWQDLFVEAARFPTPAAARQYAEQVAAQARAGADFARLVQQFDMGDARLRKGEGLGHKRGEVQPAQVEPVVWSLKAGEVGPVVDVGFGYHVVRVAQREVAGLKPFDEKCQKEIRQKLSSQILDREYKRLVEELKKKATVTVYQ